MPNINSRGITVSFMLRNRISREAPTAQRIYSGISSCTRARVSSRIADIPPIKQFSRSRLLISRCAAIVVSCALGFSNRTISMVAPLSL